MNSATPLLVALASVMAILVVRGRLETISLSLTGVVCMIVYLEIIFETHQTTS